MPPQQAYGLPDFVDKIFDLCAHGGAFVLRFGESARTIGMPQHGVKPKGALLL